MSKIKEGVWVSPTDSVGSGDSGPQKRATLRDVISNAIDLLNETCQILEEIGGPLPQEAGVVGESIEPPASCMIAQLEVSIQTNRHLAQRVRGLARALADRI